MSEITYASGYTAEIAPVPRYGMMQLAPGQSPSGYGNKISTDYMVRFNGESRRYRVYCICYSNCGSLYIIRRGEHFYLMGHELEEALGR